MKFFIVFLFLFSFLFSADYVEWRSSYDKAHQEALKNNKMLMVLLVEKDCVLCNEIIKTTFQNRPYIKDINRHFVSVIVTKGQMESYPIEMLYTMTYPSVFFLSNQELFIGKNIFGFIDSESFQKHLNLYL